jgi:dTDP-4-dehydrorhamnose reductase
MGELKVLILGDGLLGSEIHKQTGWDFTSRKKGFDIRNIEFIDKKYTTILNCIAHTDTYSEDKEIHWDVNCVFIKNLIDFCNKNNIKLIHISTDYVYANSVNNASEDDVPVHCNNWYGYTKLLGDGIVQVYSNNYLLIRCTHKPYPFPFENAWVDQIGNFDYVDKISEKIINLIVKNSIGVYNVGTETKSMFELASKTKKVNKIFSPNQVPKNTSMSLNKLKKIE